LIDADSTSVTKHNSFVLPLCRITEVTLVGRISSSFFWNEWSLFSPFQYLSYSEGNAEFSPPSPLCLRNVVS